MYMYIYIHIYIQICVYMYHRACERGIGPSLIDHFPPPPPRLPVAIIGRVCPEDERGAGACDG